jgi:prevent-host-death family protein
MPPGTRNRWTLQDAKNRFSELVRRVLTEGPQTVTRGRPGARQGQDAVVVLSAADYQRLVSRAGSLLTFLQRSPLADVELDLPRPKSPGRSVSL